jgi:small GTP-binding protein
MSRAALKICLLGEPGVGKTSLVRRIRGETLPAPPPRPGITVLPCRLTQEARGTRDITLWDVAGRSAIDTLNQAFLSGAAALVGVADAQRPETLDAARALLREAHRLQPDAVPLLLINKRDEAADRPPLRGEFDGIAAVDVSALSGHGVSAALAELQQRLSAA